jgi:hypothetical protein
VSENNVSDNYSNITPEEYIIEEIGSSFSKENYDELDMDEFATSEMQPSIAVEEDLKSRNSSNSELSRRYS